MSLQGEKNDQKLYNTKFFKEVSFKIENQILIIDVVENRLVQTVNIEGIKSSNIQEAILKSLSLKEKSPFVESEISKDLTNIKNSLIQEGYYFSNVDVKKIVNPKIPFLNNTSKY